MNKPPDTCRRDTLSLALAAAGCALALAAAGCALVLAACGSSNERGGTSSASSTYARGVRYSGCMRSHGASNFPDPVSGGGYPPSISNVNRQTPAFQSALVACAKLQPPGPSSPPPVLTEKQWVGMVRNARCIRHHGIPNFPDPSRAPSATSMDPYVPGDLNVRSPAVKQAAQACADVGTQIPGIGSG